MAKNAKQVRVALTGNVWFEPDFDAPVQDADLLTAPTTTAVNLGYTTEDGVSFTLSKETEDIKGWQTKDILRRLITSEPKSCSYVLRQLARDIWLATMGGAVTTTAGVHKWEPNDGEDIEGRVWVDFVDNNIVYRFGFRRASQSASVQFTLVRNNAVNLPNEWAALATSDGQKSFYMLTNDPAFAEVAPVGP